MVEAEKVLDFWKKIGPEGWFARKDETDRAIREQFADIHGRAARGELDHWREHPESCLALIIVLDQFSRNMYRNDPRAFAQDSHALSIANDALARGLHRAVEPNLAPFFIMPLMHSESIIDQKRCVRLMHEFGSAESLKYARIHHDIIARFGRYPHRNDVLGRHMTPAEREFLEGGGFSG